MKSMKITARCTERNAAEREAVHNIIGVCQKVISEKVEQQMKNSETYSERHSDERSSKRGCPQYYRCLSESIFREGSAANEKQ